MTIGHVEAPAHGVAQPPVLLKLWWLQPASSGLALIVIGIYAFWSALQGTGFEHGPYLSPFYSPVIQLGFWPLSPAFLSSALPLGFRATCYYYRRSYYRAFFFAPPACAVPDARRRYSGETRFPFILQNIHRYFFYAAVAFVFILAFDALLAFRFPEGLGVGLGTLIMSTNVALLALYTFGCHSCRYWAGGYVDRFHRAPIRYRLWSAVNRLNTRHGLFAWLSLFSVALTDFYIRLLSVGFISDPRIVF